MGGAMKYLLWAILILLGGCASSQKKTEALSDRSSASSYQVSVTERSVIKTGRMKLEVENTKKVASQIPELIAKAAGYVERSEIHLNSESDILAKIPAAQLDVVMDQIAALGIEKERSISVEDVTDTQIDLEAKIKNLITFRDRLRSLVTQAKTVKETVEYEEQLSRIQTDLDAIQSKLAKLKSQVAYSSLSITYGPKKILGPLGLLAWGTAWAIEKLFIIQ